MRTRRPLDFPSVPQQSRQNMLCLCVGPLSHAEKIILIGAVTCSPSSIRSANTRRARASACAMAAFRVSPIFHCTWNFEYLGNPSSIRFPFCFERKSHVSPHQVSLMPKKLRIGIAQVCNASSPLSGEVKVEESYFGARRIRGKRVAERAVKRSSSESWNATGKLHGNRP